MRRILHVISGLGTGGAETALLRLVNGLDRGRFHNTVLTLRDGPMRAQFDASGVEVLDARLGGLRDLPRTWRLLGELARSARPHVVQGWMNHGNLGALRAQRALRPRPRLVWGIRQSLYNLKQEKRATRLVIRAEAALSRAPDVILFNSSVALEQHRAQGFANALMEVIPNGFDTAKFRPDPAARRDTRAQLGVPDDAMLVGLVARYHPIKDFPMFFRAMARVLRQIPAARAVAIGTHVPDQGAMVDQLVGRELAPRVLLRDAANDVQNVYPALDVLCSTSYGEGFPNVVAEAMACGVPCVVTDAGDSATIVGDSGEVVARGDDAACAAAVARMLTDPAARAARGARARARVVDRFSLAAMTANYSRVYDSLLESHEAG